MPKGMIERIARTLCRQDGHAEDIKFEGKPMWQSYAEDAQAVLVSMRDPTEKMAKAFVDMALHGDVMSHGGWPGYARDQWNGMIDAETER